MVNLIKVVKEFGVIKIMKLVGLLMVINDIYVLGLVNVEGLMMIDSWYWDKDEFLCKFVGCFFQKMKKMFSMYQVVVYLVIMIYFKVVEVIGIDDVIKVMV